LATGRADKKKNPHKGKKTTKTPKKKKKKKKNNTKNPRQKKKNPKNPTQKKKKKKKTQRVKESGGAKFLTGEMESGVEKFRSLALQRKEKESWKQSEREDCNPV